MSESLRRKLTTVLIFAYIVFYFAFAGTAQARYLGLSGACVGSLIISAVYMYTNRNDKSIRRAEYIADALIAIAAIVLFLKYLGVF